LIEIPTLFAGSFYIGSRLKLREIVLLLAGFVDLEPWGSMRLGLRRYGTQGRAWSWREQTMIKEMASIYTVRLSIFHLIRSFVEVQLQYLDRFSDELVWRSEASVFDRSRSSHSGCRRRSAECISESDMGQV